MIKDIRVGFTAGVGPVGAAIRALDRATLKDGTGAPSKINHILTRIIYLDGLDIIFQSHGKGGVGICFTQDLRRAIADGTVFRYAEKSLELDQATAKAALERMKSFTGAGYDYRMIALYYAAMRLGWKAAPNLGAAGRHTCNEAFLKVFAGLVAWVDTDLKPTPEPLFYAAFGEASPDYFRSHASIPPAFW